MFVHKFILNILIITVCALVSSVLAVHWIVHVVTPTSVELLQFFYYATLLGATVTVAQRPSTCMTIPRLRFSGNSKAVETSNLVETALGKNN